MRRSVKRDGEKMAELEDQIKQHRKEIDEWFRSLRENEYECD